MKQLVIRNLDDLIIHSLKKIAWMDGKSPDETARRLLIEAVQSQSQRARNAEKIEPAA